MEDFVAYPSRWRIALLGLGAAAFVTLGLWMVGAFGPPPDSRRYSAETVSVIGWTSIVFFGFCALVAVRKMFDTSEQLRIGPAGIRSPPWSNQSIPWPEIADVTQWSTRGQRVIVLHLRNPDRFPGRGLAGRFVGANRLLTGGDVSISLAGTDRSFDEALAAIERFRG